MCFILNSAYTFKIYNSPTSAVANPKTNKIWHCIWVGGERRFANLISSGLQFTHDLHPEMRSHSVTALGPACKLQSNLHLAPIQFCQIGFNLGFKTTHCKYPAVCMGKIHGCMLWVGYREPHISSHPAVSLYTT